MTASKRLRLRVHGKVQGVFFRASTRDEARRLGLRGWVRNCEDGTVELLVDGPNDAVDALHRWAQTGPTHARVDDLQVFEETSNPDEFSGFEVIR